MISGSVDGSEIPLVPGYRITLRFEGGNAGGRATCNYYGGKLRIEAGSFSLTETNGTDIGCSGNLAASENAYFSALSRVDRVSTRGEELLLTGPEAILTFRALDPVPLTEVTGRRWILEAIVEGETSKEPRGDEAVLELTKDAISATTGCRRLEGEYVAQGDEIFVHTSHARGHCPNDLWDQDGLVISVIGDGFVPVVEGERLRLEDPGGRALIYRLA